MLNMYIDSNLDINIQANDAQRKIRGVVKWRIPLKDIKDLKATSLDIGFYFGADRIEELYHEIQEYKKRGYTADQVEGFDVKTMK